MIDLGPHAVYIVWAYIGVTLVTLAMIGWIVLSARAARRRLSALEARPAKHNAGGTRA